MTEYKIEKRIPFPTDIATGRGRKSIWPFTPMEIGDSILETDSEKRKRASKAAYNHARNHNRKYAARILPEGLRIWRVK